MGDYKQKDFHTVTPYIYGRLDLIEFLKQAFNAEVRFPGTGDEDGFHAEIKIGDSGFDRDARHRKIDPTRVRT